MVYMQYALQFQAKIIIYCISECFCLFFYFLFFSDLNGSLFDYKPMKISFGVLDFISNPSNPLIFTVRLSSSLQEMLAIMKSIYDMMGRYTYPCVRDEAPYEHVDKFFQVLI